MAESHTAENIAATIKDAVTEWPIPSFQGFPPLVSDNAANMTKAAKLLGCKYHIGCLAHTINIAVQKALKVKRVSHILATIRSTVAFFHRSAVAAAILKKKTQLLSLPDHKLKIDVSTRWNSAYDMLSRFLELHPAIVATLLCKETSGIKDRNVRLSDEDYALAETIAESLKPLKDITTMLCNEKSPTVSIIMPLHHRLMTDILSVKEGDCATLTQMKTIMANDLQERYAAQSIMLNVTSALDPRFKTLAYLSEDERINVYAKLATEVSQMHKDVKSHSVKVKAEPGEVRPEPPLPALPVLPNLPELNMDVDLIVERDLPVS